MNQALTISEGLYSRLQTGAQLRGLTIERLIEQAVEKWERKDAELRRRAEVVDEIDRIYEEMSAKYGMMPDSVELIREDRGR